MSLELLLVRHGKSDWTSDAPRDFDRPLAKRGRRDVPRMAEWLMASGHVPEIILSSPAERARQTAMALYNQFDGECPRVSFYQDLYSGSADALRLTAARFADPFRRCALVGHNPGMDHLVEQLCGDAVDYTPNGKLMTTAAVAVITLPLDRWSDWQAVEPHSGQLKSLMRPKML